MSSNKTIAKNTLYLYFRMFFNIGVSLYTSRVILSTLGVEDFGIYNLIAGVVVLFSFLNASMSSTTQRYINVEIASKLTARINRVFCVSFNIHVTISILVLLLSETIGLWFLNNKLNIPENRIFAANLIYQMSIITTIIGIMRVPYNAFIVAYERLSYYAVLGIFETLAKLFIVYLLVWIPNVDNLILYGFLLMCVNLLVNVVYFVYCRRNFEEQTQYRYYKDRALFKELFSFSSWMLFGQVAVVGASQGINMILNIFIGVVVNAAMGIANQVNSAVYSFVTNFQVAFRAQLIQSHAEGQLDRHKKMILNTSKYSFFLMAFLAVPVLSCTDYLLTLWLGNNIPVYTSSFVQIIILTSLLDALAGPFWLSAQAIGNIRAYNIVLTSINLMVLPLGYLLLKMGYAPTYVLVGKACISLCCQLFRYYFINKYLRFNKREFIAYIFAVFFIFLFLVSLPLLSNKATIVAGFGFFIGIVFLLEIILVTFMVLVGLSTDERRILVSFVKQKVGS